MSGIEQSPVDTGGTVLESVNTEQLTLIGNSVQLEQIPFESTAIESER